MASSRRIDRRQFVVGGAIGTLAVASCSRGAAEAPMPEVAAAGLPAEPSVVRVASVKTAVEGNVLPALIDQKPLALEPLVLADPLLQRMLVSIIVKPGGVRRVNTTGASARCRRSCYRRSPRPRSGPFIIQASTW
jgi:hypothetical protein